MVAGFSYGEMTKIVRRRLWNSLVAAVLGLTAAACFAARYSTGRFASWVPQAGLGETAVATLNAARLPVVLYDPQSARAVPDALFNFLLLREEYVAVAARQLVMLGQAPKPWLARSAQAHVVIDESQVYEHVRVGDTRTHGGGPLAFDCLAYESLGSAERHAFYQWAHGATASGQPVRMKSDRRFSRTDLNYLASDACAAYHLAARAKMGINTVLVGGETIVKEPDGPASRRVK